jgi:hypothetical protein
MPGFDETGPNGRGPMTARCEGYCALERERSDGTEMLEGIAGASGRPVQIRLDTNRKEAYTMPRGDGTGPAGMGPMTGRAAGYCAGYGVPGYTNPVGGRRTFYREAPGAGYGPPAYHGAAPYPFGLGRGFGRGIGLGRGRRGGRRGGFGRGWWW